MSIDSSKSKKPVNPMETVRIIAGHLSVDVNSSLSSVSHTKEGMTFVLTLDTISPNDEARTLMRSAMTAEVLHEFPDAIVHVYAPSSRQAMPTFRPPIGMMESDAQGVRDWVEKANATLLRNFYNRLLLTYPWKNKGYMEDMMVRLLKEFEASPITDTDAVTAHAIDTADRLLVRPLESVIGNHYDRFQFLTDVTRYNGGTPPTSTLRVYECAYEMWRGGAPLSEYGAERLRSVFRAVFADVDASPLK